MTEPQAPAVAVDGDLDRDRRFLIEHVCCYYRRHGYTCNLRTLVKETGLDKKRIYTLFPGNPIRHICQIAGLPMPPEC